MALHLLADQVIAKAQDSLTKRVQRLKENGIVPSLKVILVGNHAPSLIYTRNKKRFVESVGALCEIIQLDEKTSDRELISHLKAIEEAADIHGVIVQLPIPSHLHHLEISDYIPVQKDIDGFHPINLQRLLRGQKNEQLLVPCTPKGVMTLLEHYNISVSGKKCVILGRSMIVGKPMGMLLTNSNATVTLCHAKTENLREITKRADIVISAMGKPGMLDDTYFDSSKKSVVIDVGISRTYSGNIAGDVDFLKVEPIVSAITPVPGGIGPMTIFSVAENLILATERIHKI